MRALGDNAAKLASSLTNATASLFSYADEVAPLKELLKFFKAAGMGKTKTGLLGNQLLNESEVIDEAKREAYELARRARL